MLGCDIVHRKTHNAGSPLHLAAVLALDKSNGHAWHVLGTMEEEGGDSDAAKACYERGMLSDGMLMPTLA